MTPQNSYTHNKKAEISWTHNGEGWSGKFNPHSAYWGQERYKEAACVSGWRNGGDNISQRSKTVKGLKGIGSFGEPGSPMSWRSTAHRFFLLFAFLLKKKKWLYFVIEEYSSTIRLRIFQWRFSRWLHPTTKWRISGLTSPFCTASQIVRQMDR